MSVTERSEVILLFKNRVSSLTVWSSAGEVHHWRHESFRQGHLLTAGDKRQPFPCALSAPLLWAALGILPNILSTPLVYPPSTHTQRPYIEHIGDRWSLTKLHTHRKKKQQILPPKLNLKNLKCFKVNLGKIHLYFSPQLMGFLCTHQQGQKQKQYPLETGFRMSWALVACGKDLCNGWSEDLDLVIGVWNAVPDFFAEKKSCIRSFFCLSDSS